ncbi:hypothetical protein RJ40_06975 [Methanofollis aquaemaris]|uniref:L-2-amino-thiazoline-4-carboxylic acid hydrolase n=1 Tax=Methanofollis aquaemaris TaxID=126734 RepID=A0A8A3S5C7_9EURY|nr:hypothetical protein [Methanofollis aquaemaris]QSZ67262.1 hypothetical protein RJ40_06975 [Methanofollis aquaemaris]
MVAVGRDLIEEIRPLVRWRFAARAASLLPALYARALRDEREDPGEREQMVWYTLGQEVKTIAGTFGFPTGSAEEICEALQAGTAVIFGPEFRISILGTSEASATLIMKGCPHQGTLREAGAGEETGFSWCLPFSLAAVESLNPAYTLRFVRARCMGDTHCEMTVRRKEEA